MRQILTNKMTLIAVLISILPPTTAIAAGDIQVGEIKTYTCTGCHGIPGYNNAYPTYKVPKIVGQNHEYLVAALKAYRIGERDHATMKLQADSLKAGDIEDIAAYLASLPQSPQTGSNDSTAPEKSRLCETCHGTTGKSVVPTYPNLAGQHASYLMQALNDYRSGARTNSIMAGMASNLSQRDMAELSAWYAGQQGLRDLSIQ